MLHTLSDEGDGGGAAVDVHEGPEGKVDRKGGQMDAAVTVVDEQAEITAMADAERDPGNYKCLKVRQKLGTSYSRF